MPYFVYKITPPINLEHLGTTESYREARALVRELRSREAGSPVEQYRMMYAKQRAEAERLLSTPRDERVIGED